MDHSNNKSFWNRRKDWGLDREEEDEDLDDEMFDEEAREHEMIARIQQRLGVSREEALRIIRSSDWL